MTRSRIATNLARLTRSPGWWGDLGEMGCAKEAAASSSDRTYEAESRRKTRCHSDVQMSRSKPIQTIGGDSAQYLLLVTVRLH